MYQPSGTHVFFSLKLLRFTLNFKNILLANVISVQRRFSLSKRPSVVYATNDIYKCTCKSKRQPCRQAGTHNYYNMLVIRTYILTHVLKA